MGPGRSTTTGSDAHATDLQAALVLKAIERFDLDVTHVHYDLTDTH
jgi:hypothetical protein